MFLPDTPTVFVMHGQIQIGSAYKTFNAPKDEDQKAERKLAHDLRKARDTGELDEATKEELEELSACGATERAERQKKQNVSKRNRMCG